jgi:hypothetical protein
MVQRGRRGAGIYAPVPDEFNPFPNMPWAEAMVYLVLSQRRIPFMWRLFDGNSVYLRTLLPGWAPEFTITMTKTVIVVVGDFWGNIPPVIDRTALAKAVLEREGWKFYVIYEVDIRTKGADAVVNRLSDLRGAVGRGGPKKNPHGVPDVMEQFRRMRETSRRLISTDVRVRAGRPGTRVRRLSGAPGFVVGRSYRRPDREGSIGGNRRTAARRRRPPRGYRG